MANSHKVPGGVLRNGVLIKSAGSSLYGKGHGDLARSAGAPKKLTTPALAPGMRRVTAPSHEFLHGSPVNDETADKLCVGKNVPVHPSMTAKQVANSYLDGNALLDEAGRLGAPKR